MLYIYIHIYNICEIIKITKQSTIYRIIRPTERHNAKYCILGVERSSRGNCCKAEREEYTEACIPTLMCVCVCADIEASEMRTHLTQFKSAIEQIWTSSSQLRVFLSARITKLAKGGRRSKSKKQTEEEEGG